MLFDIPDETAVYHPAGGDDGNMVGLLCCTFRRCV